MYRINLSLASIKDFAPSAAAVNKSTTSLAEPTATNGYLRSTPPMVTPSPEGNLRQQMTNLHTPSSSKLPPPSTLLTNTDDQHAHKDIEKAQTEHTQVTDALPTTTNPSKSIHSSQQGPNLTVLESTVTTNEYRRIHELISLLQIGNFKIVQSAGEEAKGVKPTSKWNRSTLIHNHDSIRKPNLPQNTKAKINAPEAPTVTPTFATRLRAGQKDTETKIQLSQPVVTTKQGLPAVLFKREEFMTTLAKSCKFTVIGKFSRSMPRMETIRRCLTTQLQIKGQCKITHFNYNHVYIDFENELDHAMVWNKDRIFIEGVPMRLLTWTPTFKPQEETPMVPVWVNLPQLPWHCYDMDFVTKLLAPVGRVLFFDAASTKKTRGSVLKVKIEIDVTKERPHHLWIGFPQEEGDVFGDGKWQELQFEEVPHYCTYCKHQGHLVHNYPVC